MGVDCTMMLLNEHGGFEGEIRLERRRELWPHFEQLHGNPVEVVRRPRKSYPVDGAEECVLTHDLYNTPLKSYAPRDLARAIWNWRDQGQGVWLTRVVNWYEALAAFLDVQPNGTRVVLWWS